MGSSPKGRLGAATSVAAAVLALAGTAAAQAPARDRFALGAMEPAPAGDRFFRLESPELLGHGAVDALLLLDTGFSPFVVERPAEGGGREPRAVVPLQILTHAGLALTLWDRVKLSADMPFGGASVADDVESPGEPYSSAAVVGDLRGGMRLRLLGEPGDGLRASLSGYLWLPTGDARRFAGEGMVRGSPRLVLGGKLDDLTWGLAGGVVFRPEAEAAGVTFGRQLTLDGGISVAISGLGQVILEGRVAPVIAGPDALSRQTTVLDGTFGWRARISDFTLGIGLTFAKAVGSGALSMHIVPALAYAPLERPGSGPRWVSPPTPPGVPTQDDADGDGLPDYADACPDARGPESTGGCPDADSDGVQDAQDACPARPGPAEGRGCPVHDRDGDGIPDEDDTCPDLAGGESDLDRDRGCPGDRDGDGVSDPEDACPDARGRFSLHPDRNGCPKEPAKKGR